MQRFLPKEMLKVSRRVLSILGHIDGHAEHPQSDIFLWFYELQCYVHNNSLDLTIKPPTTVTMPKSNIKRWEKAIEEYKNIILLSNKSLGTCGEWWHISFSILRDVCNILAAFKSPCFVSGVRNGQTET